MLLAVPTFQLNDMDVSPPPIRVLTWLRGMAAILIRLASRVASADELSQPELG